VPDLCFYNGNKKKNRQEGEYTLVTDGMIDPNKFIQIAGSTPNSIYTSMIQWKDIYDFCRIVSRAKKIISGRYHGVVFALMYGIPFEWYHSHTHKIVGLVDTVRDVEDIDQGLYPEMIRACL